MVISYKLPGISKKFEIELLDNLRQVTINYRKLLNWFFCFKIAAFLPQFFAIMLFQFQFQIQIFGTFWKFQNEIFSDLW